MLLAQGISFLALVAYFLTAARSLGAEGYGAFIGIAALAGVIAPFSVWGADHLLVKNVSVNRDSLPVGLGNGLFLIATSGTVLALLSGLILSVLFSNKVPEIAIFSILISELIGLRIILLMSSVFTALSLFPLSALTKVVAAVSKLIAVTIFAMFFAETGIIGWSVIYSIGTFLPALVAVALVCWKLASPKISFPSLLAEMKQGFYFSINECSGSINANLDKSMLASLSSLTAAGFYSAAYRFVDFGYFPLFSVQAATYPRFFKHGASGIKGSWSFARRLLPLAFMYGGASAFLMIFVAPILIPWVLGSEYKEATSILIWLSPIHLLISLQFLLEDSLTASGFQGIRSAIQVTSAVINFGLNFLLIPLLSWKGAAAATLVSETFKLITLSSFVFVYYKKQDLKRAEINEYSD